MRCARCDRLAIPQAVAQSPKGLVVYGWCLRCLEETGCQQIAVATRVKRPGTRVDFEAKSSRTLSRVVRTPRKPSPRSSLNPDDRRRLVGTIALLLSLWGLALLVVGVVFGTLHSETAPSPLGNGTPALLIGGGASTAVVGLTLWLMTTGIDAARSRPTLKAIQVVTFLLAMVAILMRVAAQSPRRDPLLLGVASLALALSVSARWLETRLILVKPRR
ncbi:MAG: hypothetical protein U0835_09700 [Isosphaeraceae bacterium]